MPRYASLIYNGYWWSPERKLLQTMIDASQAPRQRLGAPQALQGQRDRRRARFRRPTRCSIRTSRRSKTTQGAYDQMDAAGFIKLNALRMRIAANLKKKK